MQQPVWKNPMMYEKKKLTLSNVKLESMLMFTVCSPLPRANLYLLHDTDGHARFTYPDDHIPDLSESKQQQSLRHFPRSLLHCDYPPSHNHDSPVFHGGLNSVSPLQLQITKEKTAPVLLAFGLSIPLPTIHDISSFFPL